MLDRTVLIEELGLSVRSTNALKRAGILTVGDILEQTEESLGEIKNMGKKSVAEVLDAMVKLRIEALRITEAQPASAESSPPEDLDVWLREEDAQEEVRRFLRETGKRILELDLLSARAYNLLSFGGYDGLDTVVFLSEEDLMKIPGMDKAAAEEIKANCRRYLEENRFSMFGWIASHPFPIAQTAQAAQVEPESPRDLLTLPNCRETVLAYLRENDREVEELALSNRAKGRLTANGLTHLSGFIFYTKGQLLSLPHLGEGVAEEIMTLINGYLEKHGARMLALYRGDTDALWSDDDVRKMILALYKEKPFGGFSFAEFLEALKLPETFPQERLKRIIGSLLAEKTLEYVDYRCYRVYEPFSEYLEKCTGIEERDRAILLGRLQGKTLEEVGQEQGVTRERVRQIAGKGFRKVQSRYYAETGIHQFDEDYFRYFYETYDLERKDAAEWFGISGEIWNYLDMSNARKGKKPLRFALEDNGNLDAGLRLKIKNYLNRNKIYIDGMWVEKKRSELEELVVRKYCAEDVSFSRFAEIYNEFLAEEEIPYDESLYYTESILRTRKARLAESRYLLWKQNEQIRAYDIDGRDYTELLETLNLDAYENISLSTMKFMEMYPELMDRYDIRNQYELHNLLRKVVPEGSYHDFHCGKMPEIRFGTFDRDAAILDILIDSAPVSLADLCTRIHEEYGYDPAVIASNYLQPFSVYYHQGIYSIDQKQMPEERRNKLKAVLSDSFYYIDEVKKTYGELFPDGDLEEVNPYNLKSMGFQVLSRYVLQGYPSLEAYFEELITREDIMDLAGLRRRFGSIQAYYSVLLRLKRELAVTEFEPDRVIQFRVLEHSGMTREMIRDFCNAVYDFAEDRTCFSIRSMRQNGFQSILFEWGFTDWFYANLLISDERFSYTQAFRTLIFIKGEEDLTIKAFLLERIRAHGTIDTYDLMHELEETYGINPQNKWDILERIKGTQVYYDDILDRLYAHADLYYRELDEMGGVGS